jgi:hypothetical protein
MDGFSEQDLERILPRPAGSERTKWPKSSTIVMFERKGDSFLGTLLIILLGTISNSLVNITMVGKSFGHIFLLQIARLSENRK